MKSFGDVVESVETLSMEDQEELLSILQGRLCERRRAELVKEVKAARKEFRTGRCRPGLPEEILREITQ